MLITKAKSPSFKGMPVLPGGLVGLHETTDAAAVRILGDVLTSTDFYRQQLFTFDDPKRDPNGRVVSVAYMMVLPWDKAQVVIKPTAYWRPTKKLPKLGYDHDAIARLAVRRLKGRITYTTIVTNLMPDEFTLTELQGIYEAVLGTKLDKRNFVKKIKNLKLLKSTGKKKEGAPNRPAALFRFIDSEYRLVEIF
jgi:8-oxo-dGTP diphosphatase